MTRNEFLEFLKTDPIFKVADKQIVATLYESPFDNVVFDDEAGEVTYTLHGEDFTFALDDADFAAILEDNPYLDIIMLSKRVIISVGFREHESMYGVIANDSNITESAIINFPAPADDDDDDDDGGGNLG